MSRAVIKRATTHRRWKAPSVAVGTPAWLAVTCGGGKGAGSSVDRDNPVIAAGGSLVGELAE